MLSEASDGAHDGPCCWTSRCLAIQSIMPPDVVSTGQYSMGDAGLDRQSGRVRNGQEEMVSSTAFEQVRCLKHGE